MAVKAVYFDLYGTLYKYGDMRTAWDDWFDTLYRNFIEFNKSLTKESLALKCEGFFSKEEPTGIHSDLSVFERRIQRLSIELGLEIPDNVIRKTAYENLSAWQQHIYLDEQTIPLLEKLFSNYELGLITNFDHPQHVYNLLIQDKIAEYFSTICISGEIGYKKPDKRIFDYAVKNINTNRNEILFVGDTNDDVTGSINAGITPVLINRETKLEEMIDYNIIEDKSSYVLNSQLLIISKLNEIFEILSNT